MKVRSGARSVASRSGHRGSSRHTCSSNLVKQLVKFVELAIRLVIQFVRFVWLVIRLISFVKLVTVSSSNFVIQLVIRLVKFVR